MRFKSDFYGHEALANGDPVAEWRVLQNASTPVVLADYLTWLRKQGEAEPRFLTTVADRPASGAWIEAWRSESDKSAKTVHFSLVPLDPFFAMMRDTKAGVSENGRRDIDRRQSDRHDNDGYKQLLAAGVNLSTRPDEVRGGHHGMGPSRKTRCSALHLVVDGVIFQVDGSAPEGIARVWTRVLPVVSRKIIM